MQCSLKRICPFVNFEANLILFPSKKRNNQEELQLCAFISLRFSLGHMVRNLGAPGKEIRSRFRGRVDSISRYYLVEPILLAMLPRGQVRYAPVLRDVKPQTTTTSEVSILMKGSC